jgi:hypothetical protein
METEEKDGFVLRMVDLLDLDMFKRRCLFGIGCRALISE